MEKGANANLLSPEINHTALHWLAYWGDHRAIDVLLDRNMDH